MPAIRRKKRVPKLQYTGSRGIGWHVAYRDPKSGTPRRHRFGMVSREEAESAYYDWLAAHMRGQTPEAKPKRTKRKLADQLAAPKARPQGVSAQIVDVFVRRVSEPIDLDGNRVDVLPLGNVVILKR